MARINADGTIDKDAGCPEGAAGTSFHGAMIRTTVNALREVFGEPDYSDPEASEKVSADWTINSPFGVFTIYDWKEYEAPAFANPDAVYDFHLGEHGRGTAGKALALVVGRLATDHRLELEAGQ
ncbi:hypothetical protein [Nonomuraea basaltis]|uniref:hypothetical protein n=1 Tax=Nonomuraea basaltis TaxID=2495887 RepID=UPI00110C450C|nr:hypothetical protein [Nonomuraea basaltis]TMR91311.1 hypothetical protein EJK15_50875 [Nonomuraea basaltis]